MYLDGILLYKLAANIIVSNDGSWHNLIYIFYMKIFLKFLSTLSKKMHPLWLLFKKVFIVYNNINEILYIKKRFLI